MMEVRNAEAGILRMRKGEQAVEEKADSDLKPMHMQFGTSEMTSEDIVLLKNLKYRRDI